MYRKTALINYAAAKIMRERSRHPYCTIGREDRKSKMTLILKITMEKSIIKTKIQFLKVFLLS